MPTEKRIETNEIVEISPAPVGNVRFAQLKLTELLGGAKLIKLVKLVENVIEETGYGDVKIVIAEGKVQMLKAEHSYK